MLDEPTIGPGLRARYMLTLENQYKLEDLLALIDAWEQENRPSALRDESMWGDAYFDYGAWSWRNDFLDHDGEVAYLEDWLFARWDYLAGLY